MMNLIVLLLYIVWEIDFEYADFTSVKPIDNYIYEYGRV